MEESQEEFMDHFENQFSCPLKWSILKGFLAGAGIEGKEGMLVPKKRGMVSSNLLVSYVPKIRMKNGQLTIHNNRMEKDFEDSPEFDLEQLEMIQEADKVREETERDNEDHKEWMGEFTMEEGDGNTR